MTPVAPATRPFDVVLLGATGFAGGFAAERLAAVAPAGLRWAVAGRSEERVAALADRFSCGCVVADVTDASSMRGLAESARVVLSTAGPFAKLGTPVVDACVAAGTHYADLTGEVPWIRAMVDRHHARAKADGTTILPASGFDSVPADVATFVAMGEAERRGVVLSSLRTVYRLRGGLNGGTLASVLDIMENGDRRLLADPFSLVPDASVPMELRRALGDPTRPTFDETGGRHVAPFFMAGINRRVVRRSIELAKRGDAPAISAERAAVLGETFRYDEYQSVSKGRGFFSAWMATATLGAGALVLSTDVGRRLAARFGPSPGEGPSEEALRAGLTEMTTTCYGVSRETGQDEKFVVRQSMKGDPGNAATVRILVEVGLALAAGEGQGGGVLTSMSALGRPLCERLQRTGGHQVSVS